MHLPGRTRRVGRPSAAALLRPSIGVGSSARWLLAVASMLVSLGGLAPAASADSVDWQASTAQPPVSAPFAAGIPVSSLSCPTTSLCAAVTENGAIFTSPGVAGPWTRQLRNQLAVFTDIDCASATQCVAVALNGVAYGSATPTVSSSWKVLFNQPARHLRAVSCVAAACFAAGDVGGKGVVVASNDPLNGTWRDITFFDGSSYPDIVCVQAPDFRCIIITGGGQQISTTNPSASSFRDWSFLGGPPVVSASCPTSASCWGVQADGDSDATRVPGVFYEVTRNLPGDGGARISCPTENFCLEVLPSGTARRSSDPANGTSWSTAALSTAPIRTVDCAPGSARCVIALEDGRLVSSTNVDAATPTWTTTPGPIEAVNSIADMDCVSATACVAVDTTGHLLTSQAPKGGGDAWTQTTIHPSGRAAKTVDCPDTTLCVASYTDGELVTVTDPFGAPTATVRKVAGSVTVTAVACPTASLCVATTDAGKIVSSTDPTSAAWTTRSIIAAPIDFLACSSATECRAVTRDGRALRSTDPAGGTWSSPANVADLSNPSAMSCIGAKFCVIGTSDGRLGYTGLPAEGAQFRDFDLSGSTPSPITAVECTRQGMCIATTADRHEIELTLSNFVDVNAVKSTISTEPRALACDATSVCLIGGRSGEITAGTQNRNTVTITKSGDGAGKVSNTASTFTDVHCGTVCTIDVPRHTGVGLVATPDPGSVFRNFATDVQPVFCQGDNSACFSVDENVTIDAEFRQASYALSLSLVGPGRVTSAPAGLVCTASCSATFDRDTDVTLTATPKDGGATFTGWSGACAGESLTCQVTMDQARSATATFRPAQRALTVTSSGPGKVSGAPDGIDCGPTCAANYADGSIVTLTAIPDAGGPTFTGWTGACSGTAATCQVTMDGDQAAPATFAKASEPAEGSAGTTGANPNPGAGTPTTGGTSGGPASAGPPAPGVPLVTGATLSSPAFEAGAQVTFSLTTNELGTTKIAITKSTDGRKAAGACKPETKKNRKAKRCTFDKLVTTLTGPAATGKLTIAFNGKLGNRKLAPGTYKATITVTGTTGLVSKPTVITFKVKPARKTKRK